MGLATILEAQWWAQPTLLDRSATGANNRCVCPKYQRRKPMATAQQSWLDDKSQTPLIDGYAQKLTTFVEAMADGRVDARELADQEKRLVTLMKEVEPTLNETQHPQVTKLLCELTAYNVMQTLNSLQSARPKTKFRG
jgi:hypothetical protein